MKNGLRWLAHDVSPKKDGFSVDSAIVGTLASPVLLVMLKEHISPLLESPQIYETRSLPALKLILCPVLTPGSVTKK